MYRQVRERIERTADSAEGRVGKEIGDLWHWRKSVQIKLILYEANYLIALSEELYKNS